MTNMYSRNNGNWTLIASLSQDNNGSNEGSSVSISADGTTVAAGAPSLMQSFPPFLIGGTQLYKVANNQWYHSTTLTQATHSAEGCSVSRQGEKFRFSAR